MGFLCSGLPVVSGGPGLCLVTGYPPGRRELGGSGWIDRHVLPVLQELTGELDVVCVTGPGGSWSESGVTAHSAGSVPLEVRSDRRRLVRIAAHMAVSTQPYLTAKFTSFPGWQEAVALLRARAAGRRVVTSGWPASVLAAAAGVRVDAHIAHNVESVIADEHSPLALRALGERRRLRRAERALLRRPRHVFTLSRTDARTLAGWGIGADQLPLPLRPVESVGCAGRAVGFIGKATWPPNERVLETLLGPVHERLERLGVPVEFVLAGTGTERHAEHPRVVASGRVDDEADFYRRVGLVLVPRFGASTGVSVKMLEAAEHGVASVVPQELAEAVDPVGPWWVAADAGAVARVVARWFSGATPPDVLGWVADCDPARTASRLGAALGGVEEAGL